MFAAFHKKTNVFAAYARMGSVVKWNDSRVLAKVLGHRIGG
jgi:hypothetical protein